PADLFGRLGGEEFAAVLIDVSAERACEIAEGLRDRFALAARTVEEHAVRGTVSIGVAHCDGPVLDVPELLAQADRALYFPKENGRNRIQLASLDLFSSALGREPADAPAGT